MTYGIYRKGRKIRKIIGNPRAPSNQKGLIIWAPTQKGVKSWIREWGSKTMKKKYI